MDQKGRVLSMDVLRGTAAASSDRWVVLAGSVSRSSMCLKYHLLGGRASIVKLLFFVASFQLHPLLFLCVLTKSRH